MLLEERSGILPRSILDIGTGTGYVVESLLPYFPNSAYTLNDISECMLEKARAKLQHLNSINFHLGDAEQCEFLHHDLIISNFAFQWFEGIKETIAKLWEHTDVLAFSTLLDGTFSEWWELCSKARMSVPKFQYPTYDDLQQYCLALGSRRFYFAQDDISITMESPIAFARYIKQLGANFHDSSYNNFLPFAKHQQLEVNTSYKVFFAILSR